MHLVKMRPKSYPLDPVRRVKKKLVHSGHHEGGMVDQMVAPGPAGDRPTHSATAAMLAGEAAAKGGLWHSGKPPFIEDLAFNATTHPSQDKKKKMNILSK